MIFELFVDALIAPVLRLKTYGLLSGLSSRSSSVPNRAAGRRPHNPRTPTDNHPSRPQIKSGELQIENTPIMIVRQDVEERVGTLAAGRVSR